MTDSVTYPRVGPQHTGSVVDSRTSAGSRPDCSQIRRKFANRAAADCCTALGASTGVKNFEETLARV